MSGLSVPPERCGYCGIDVHVYDTGAPNGEWRGRTVPKDQRTVDHVLPRSEGGRGHGTVKVVCCSGCNDSKANRTPLEWLLAGGVTAEMLSNGSFWHRTGMDRGPLTHLAR